MKRFFLTLITFGMKNLDLQSDVRTHEAMLSFGRYGVPAWGKVKKVLLKYFTEEEILGSYGLQNLSPMYTDSEESGRRLIKDLIAVGIPDEDDWVGQLTNPIIHKGNGEYLPTSKFNYCNNCDRTVRLFREQLGNASCERCGSTDVVDVSKLKPKELLQHVAKKKAA